MPGSILVNVQCADLTDTGPLASEPGLNGGNVLSYVARDLRALSERSFAGIFVNGAASEAVAASAGSTFSFASASGTVSIIINGVSVDITATGTNVDDCLAMAQAINSSTNARVKGLVQASNVFAGIACDGVQAGDVLGFAGMTFVAIPQGQRAFDGQFAIGASDSATAVNLAAAINAQPSSTLLYFVQQSADQIYIAQKSPGALLPSSQIYSSNNGRLTITPFGAYGVGAVWATLPGFYGNHMTLTAAGTGLALIGGSGGRMTGGVGLSGVPLTEFR